MSLAYIASAIATLNSVVGEGSSPFRSLLIEKGSVPGTKGNYTILADANGLPFAQSQWFTFYMASLPTGQYGLMKITSKELNAQDRVLANAALESEARILQAMHSEASEIDRQAEQAGQDPYNFGSFFPRVVDSFESNDGRHVLILGYAEVINSQRQLQPLRSILQGTHGQQRLDLKTGTWILNKILKVLSLTSTLGISNNNVSSDNILIMVEFHGAILFDWSLAEDHVNRPRNVSWVKEQGKDIASAARVVWSAVGGSMNTEPPHDPEILTFENHQKYLLILRELMTGQYYRAGEVQSTIVEMADMFWPKKVVGGIMKRDFHPFTLYPTTGA